MTREVKGGFMKWFVGVLSGLFFVVFSSFAQATTKSDFLKSYADFAYSQYGLAHQKAVELKTAIHSLVQDPSQVTLEQARSAWIEARQAYLPTEVLRFAEGPIDQEGGPEGLLNSWPLDEAAIDYVVGNASSGIINDATTYPEITEELLTDLNQKEGETNVTTGYHAIEFLLWGQDLSAQGPGNRKFTDYTGTGKANADRRSQYLSVAASLLEKHLHQVLEAWNPSRADSYYNFLLSPAQADTQTKAILEALIKFTGEELSQERMFVAYDTQQQEEEHSCFSDTTHLDFIYNFSGVQTVLNGHNKLGGLVSLIEVRSKDQADKISALALETEKAIASIPAPFDQAILNEQGRKKVLKSIQALELLSDNLKQAGSAL